HCRRHVEHHARHGSHWHGSYSAADLKPYLRAAESWIKTHGDDTWLKHDLASVGIMLDTSGRAEPATALRGRSPRERARIALARLRDAGIKPERIVAIALAVHAADREDPITPGCQEFREVQIAKAAHRLASGYHRKFDWPMRDGDTGVYVIHEYARSTGRVLRHLGKAIDEACSHVVAHHLDAVLALKVDRYGARPLLAPSPTAPR
ncbi:MAG: hypothetical protein RLO48_06930, partial [Bauldia litoralis]